jgi:hypothetical protein
MLCGQNGRVLPLKKHGIFKIKMLTFTCLQLELSDWAGQQTIAYGMEGVNIGTKTILVEIKTTTHTYANILF